MIIEGKYNEEDWFGEVKVDGKILNLKPSLKVRNHSPTGFAWGYEGSGPAQLALAILLEAGCSPELATYNGLYQQFKREFIGPIPRDNFRIEVDIKDWIYKKTGTKQHG